MSSQSEPATSQPPEILARGPWPLEHVTASWREEQFEPTLAQSEAADAAIKALQDRGSPSHDGVAGRLVGYHVLNGGIAIELQPLRWALRLVAGDASQSVAALCVTRSFDGRWLAGRRAAWVSSWAGRWGPAERSISARTRPRRSCGSCARSGRSRRSGCAARRCCACRTGS